MTKKDLPDAVSSNRLLNYITSIYKQILILLFVFAIVLAGNTTLAQSEHNNLIGGGEPTLDAVASMQIARDIATEASMGVSSQLSAMHDETFAAAAVPTLSEQYLQKPQLASTNENTVNDIRVYQVKAGETIASISEKFNITTDTIRWVNGVGDWEEVSTGDKLTILPVDGVLHIVEEGESAESIANQYQSYAQQIIAFNDAEVTGLEPGKQIVVPDGILPEKERPQKNGTGPAYVRVNGCDVSGVSAVERVYAGDVIGFMGSSGISTGKHLHFEVCKDGELINPVTDTASKALVEGLIWPLQDTQTQVSRWYGCSSVWSSHYSSECAYGFFHAGIDITDSYSRSTPIIASADGAVLFKGYSVGYGYNVVIRHENGYVSRYAHLRSIN